MKGYYCNAEYGSKGNLEIKYYDEKVIQGKIEILYSNKDILHIDFDVPLTNIIPKIPMPAKTIDGVILKNIPITDEYPDDGF